MLAEIVRLMTAAEGRKGRYVRLADRAARLYAPLVHLAAVSAFACWVTLGGLAWQPALLIAVSVLIVTCPCALGLAVPAAQVGGERTAAARRHPAQAARRARAAGRDRHRRVRQDRHADARHAAPDLARRQWTYAHCTTRRASPPRAATRSAAHWSPRRVWRSRPRPAYARRRAVASRSRPRRASRGSAAAPGAVSRRIRGRGRSPSCGSRGRASSLSASPSQDTLRPGAAEAVRALRAKGLRVMLLSGDRPGAVRAAAARRRHRRLAGALHPAGQGRRPRGAGRRGSQGADGGRRAERRAGARRRLRLDVAGARGGCQPCRGRSRVPGRGSGRRGRGDRDRARRAPA